MNGPATDPFTAAAHVADFIAATHEHHLAQASDDAERCHVLNSLGLGRALADIDHVLRSTALDDADDTTLAYLFEVARTWRPRDPRAAELEATIRAHIQSRHDLDLPASGGTPITTSRRKHG